MFFVGDEKKESASAMDLELKLVCSGIIADSDPYRFELLHLDPDSSVKIFLWP
jgi:hypothetical protein